MAKDWDRYKGEISTLYITNGKSLDEVRRILKGRHRFDASVRAYRMRLEEWGIRKNKVTTRLANHVRSRGLSKPTDTNGEARPPKIISATTSAMDTSSLASVANLQFQNQEDWVPNLRLTPGDRQDSGSSGLVAPNAFQGFAPIQLNLHEIIPHGTENEISNLLSSGILVNTKDGVNYSPLHIAILRGDIGIVKLLLNYGADVDSIGFRRKTPLHLAIVSKGVFQLLLKYQPNLSLQDDDGNTILHSLLHVEGWWKDLDIKTEIKAILASGANVNMVNNSGETPFRRLVMDIVPESAGYLDIVSEFLNYKPNVTSIMRNNLPILVVFLINTDVLSNDSGYPSETARIGFRCLGQFFDAGANPNIMFHSKPLLHYCLEKCTVVERSPLAAFINRLIQIANVDSAGSHGNKPLHLALDKQMGVSYGRRRYETTSCSCFTLTTALVNRKVNVNVINDAGASPLELCIRPGWHYSSARMKVALLLVKAGAFTTRLTSTQQSLFDFSYMPKLDRIKWTKIFLAADINSQQDDSDAAPRLEWAAAWCSTWKQSLWHLAKSHLAELRQAYSQPKTKEFHDCAFVVVAEHLLERHKSQLELWRAGNVPKESVKENFEEYCAILKDCRDQIADIKASWYTYLLDLMDYK